MIRWRGCLQVLGALLLAACSAAHSEPVNEPSASPTAVSAKPRPAPELKLLRDNATLPMGTGLVGDGDTLYFVSGDKLMAMSLTSNQTHIVKEDTLNSLIIATHLSGYGGFAYWSDPELGLVQLRLSDGDVRVMDPSTSVGPVVADASGVYGCSRQGLLRYAQDGTRTVVSPLPCRWGPQALALSAHYVWMITNEAEPRAVRVDKQSGAVTRSLPLPKASRPDDEWVASLDASSDEVAVVDWSAPNGPTSVLLWDGAVTPLFQGPGRINDLCNIVVDGVFAYFTVMSADPENTQTLYRVELKTLERTEIGPLDEGYEVVLHRGTVFFLGHVSGRIWRLVQ
ncbi:MAG: hypothetical protein U0271_47540 [Polyangiaceae bacterium]